MLILKKIGHIYPGSNQIPTPPICQRVTSWFSVEELDPEIDDNLFPRWIPLDSVDRKEIYASGKRGYLYRYSLVLIDDEKEIKNE